MKAVAIITARGGSKRIPRKNIKEFMGHPMIAYAIKAALGAHIFDEVMVSTDDNEIAEVSKSLGAEVPFMRSEEMSGDFATTAEVLCEVLANYEKMGKRFDCFCCLYPCVPLLDAKTLREAFERFEFAGCDSLMPVARYSHPIQRALRIGANGFAEYCQPEFQRARSQDLAPTFHDAGMFYFSKTETFLASRSLVSGKTVLYEMEESCIQDIDTLEDWRIAELKYKMIHHV